MKNNGNGALPGTVPDKLQPHNVDAERAVLGSLLIAPDEIIQISAFLAPADFYVERHGWIYDAIRDLHDRREPADMIVLEDELIRRKQLESIGGPAYLTGLINACETHIHIKYYANIVTRTASLRRLIDAGADIARLGFRDETDDVDSVIDEAERIIFEATSRHNQDGFEPIMLGVGEAIDRIEYLHNHQGVLSGLPTGLGDLDKLLGGLQRSDLILLAGRPSMGKTALALFVALYAGKKWQTRTGIFSMEMSHEQLSQRLIATESGINTQRLRLGDIKENEWPALVAATELISGLPVFVEDTPNLSAFDLRSRARRLHAEHGLDLLIVDYIQLMDGLKKKENRQQEISFISRQLKALARELNIPVLALSQLNRECESRHDKRPMLSDLRESGSLEQDADVAMFLYRDEMYNEQTEHKNITEVLVRKHRSGPTGIVSVFFDETTTKFRPLTRQEEMEPWREHV